MYINRWDLIVLKMLQKSTMHNKSVKKQNKTINIFKIYLT